MRPMLDDVDLPQVQAVTSQDVRVLAEHVAPGGAASQLQDLGRTASRIVVVGIATEAAVAPLVQRVDAAVRSGSPVTFVSDVTAASQLQQVIVEDARFEDVAGRPGERRYRLVLREHLVPAPASATTSTDGLDADVLAEASGAIGDLTAGLDAATDFAGGLERFLPSLGDLLGRLREFQERLEATRQ